MNIYPEDLEFVLRIQKEVRDCVVVGLQRGGNAEPCAVLILHHHNPVDSPAIAQSLVERVNETLAEYQRMHRWFVWPEPDFPRSSAQKPRRNVIREFVENAFRGQTSPATGSSLTELLTQITGRAVRDLNPQAGLESGLGLTSLERVELFGALEDQYQLDLSETRLAQATTVGDLEKLMSGRGEDQVSSPSKSPAFHYPTWALRWPTTWIRLAVQYLLIWPSIFVLARPRIIGRANLHGVRGPLLIVSNHITHVDIGFIQVALPAQIRHQLITATAGERLESLRSSRESRWLGRIYDRMKWTLGVALLNLFPLPREANPRKSFAYAGGAVDRGYNVLVFPEGKHTEDGQLGPFRRGIGLLASNLQIPVVPMRIDGLLEIRKANKKWARPQKIQVRIGKPLRFDRAMGSEQIACALREAVERL